MDIKIAYTIILLGLLGSIQLIAQESNQNIGNSSRIMGSRFIPSPNYTGKPYLNDKFIFGEIEFTDGTKMDHIGLNYSTYRDELIYYNTTLRAQIQIDKISLNSFTLVDQFGKKRIFHRQYCSASLKSECYFEVLSEGDIALLVYRKVNLESCSTYYSKSGLAYQPANIYYFYSESKGYTPVNPSRNSFLSKFEKSDQKTVRKMLRKNGIIIAEESGLINAWNLIKENSIRIKF
jgi:hypothetical protein